MIFPRQLRCPRRTLTVLAAAWLALATLPALAQRSVTYDISFPNAAHHEADITVTFTGAPTYRPLEVRMSRTSPGRYALHEFAKNVYDVRVTDGSGQALPVTRPNLHQWNVSGHDGTVRVAYTLFGDQADGTYTGIDNTHAHLNMPATFMWARGMEDAPVRITFHRPDPSWTIATQLFPTDDPETFTAPDFAYFIDSPTEISDLDLRTWEVTSTGTTSKIRLAVHHAESAKEVDTYVAMAKKVVDEQIALYGETPDYEPGTYTFIADYLPYVDGDGMEHRNSTILTSTRPLSTGALRNLGTLSHEFFHQWNVERLRPKALEPFDFETANMSGELWFAEGFTSYYDDLTIRRAGLTDDSTYAHGLSGVVNTIVNAPGRQFYSPVEMSMQAPFVDAATSVDPQNKQNTFISYYTWGAGIGLGLDLMLRSRFNGVTLDDYMRALWTRYGKPERPYTVGDLQHVLGEITGDPGFADDVFEQYVEGHEAMDYEALLAHAGFLVRQAHPDQTWLGASVEDRDGHATVVSGPLISSPLYEARLDRGDTILELDDQSIESAEDVQAMIADRQPGDQLAVTFGQRGVTKQATLALTADPTLEVVTYEDAGRSITPEMQRFRDRWLRSNIEE